MNVETKVRTDQATEVPLAPNNLPAIAQPQQDLRPARTSKPRPAKEFPAKIAKSIIAITMEIGRIQKGGVHEFHKYRYTRWEDISEKLSPLLAQNGLIIVQSEISRDLLEKGEKGSTLAIVYHFTIVNEDGDRWPDVEWTAISRLTDQKGVTDDKAASKCHTSAEKQFCVKQFKIRTGDDEKADRHPTLPKKDAKDIYTKMENEIDEQPTIAALKEWGMANIERKRVLPIDWQEILGERYNEKMADLENQTRTAPVMTSTLDAQPESGPVIWDEPASPYHGEQRTSPPRGETVESAVPGPIPTGAADTLSVADMAREAAMRGREVLRGYYKSQPPAKRKVLDDMKAELEALIPVETV